MLNRCLACSRADARFFPAAQIHTPQKAAPSDRPSSVKRYSTLGGDDWIDVPLYQTIAFHRPQGLSQHFLADVADLLAEFAKAQRSLFSQYFQDEAWSTYSATLPMSSVTRTSMRGSTEVGGVMFRVALSLSDLLGRKSAQDLSCSDSLHLVRIDISGAFLLLETVGPYFLVRHNHGAKKMRLSDRTIFDHRRQQRPSAGGNWTRRLIERANTVIGHRAATKRSLGKRARLSLPGLEPLRSDVTPAGGHIAHCTILVRQPGSPRLDTLVISTPGSWAYSSIVD